MDQVSDRQDVIDAWEAWAAETPADECGGYDEDPNPPRDIEQRVIEDRFRLEQPDTLTPDELESLPPAEEDYTEAPDF